MSRPRRVQIVILCEDNQHEAFVRRFLYLEGWEGRQIRVVKSPSGRGAAEGWVRRRYPVEVGGLRSRPDVARGLIVMLDADLRTCDERRKELDDELRASRMDGREDPDRICIVVPRRSIETWLTYLRGNDVDETTRYPRLEHERECVEMVRTLKQMCDLDELRRPAPESLEQSCAEYRTRIKDKG